MVDVSKRKKVNQPMFQSLSWIVGSIILVLVATAVFVLLRAWNKLGSEQRAISALQQMPMLRNVDSAQKLLSGYNDTAVGRALEGAIDSGSVATEQLNLREWIYWSRYCAGIFVFVGLAGTVGGIAFAVSNLGQTVAVTSNLSASAATATSSSSFSMDNWNKLLHGINDLLGGMTSASVCTLAGLAATLFVSFLNSCYFASCDRIEASVELLANKLFYPVWRMAKENQDISHLVGATNTLVLAADSLTASSDKFQTEMVSAANELQEKIISAANDLPAVYQDAQYAYSQIIQEANSLFGQMHQLTQSLQTDAASVSQGYSKLEKTLNKAGVTLQQDCQLLVQSAEALSNASSQMTKEREGLAYAANVVSSSAAQMEQAVRQLQAELLGTQKTREERLESLLSNMDKTHKSMSTMMNKMDSTLSRLPALADMTAVSREIAGIRTEISAQLKAATQQVTAAVASQSVRQDTRTSYAESNYGERSVVRDTSLSSARPYANSNAAPSSNNYSGNPQRDDTTLAVTSTPVAPASSPTFLTNSGAQPHEAVAQHQTRNNVEHDVDQNFKLPDITTSQSQALDLQQSDVVAPKKSSFFGRLFGK